MSTQQQRPSSLKAFVRVSKNRDGPAGKDDAKPVMRLTRSRTAALSAAAKAAESPASSAASSVCDTVLSPPLPTATRTTTRKRKLVSSSDAVATEGSPAKRPVRATRSSQKRLQLDSPSKSATTISAYFPKTPTATRRARGDKTSMQASPGAPNPDSEPAPVKEGVPAANASVEDTSPCEEKKTVVTRAENPQLLPVAGDNEKTDTASPAGSRSGIVDKAALNARANVLLARLRNRTKASSGSVEAEAAGGKIEETRAIQESIRARRHEVEATATPVGSTTSTATFESLKNMPDTTSAALKRQFVLINSRVGGNPSMPREFKKLEELFQGLEHAVMFSGQQDGVIYHRVRKSVEAMAKRTFGWKELGQILAVYPESYTYKPVMTTHAGRRVQSVLIVPVAKGVNQAVEMEGRRDEFKRRLVERTTSAHSAFLISRGYRESEIEAISGWHPSFDIESVPSVAPIAMPPQQTGAGHSLESGSVASFNKDKLRHLLARKDASTAADAADTSSSQPSGQAVSVDNTQSGAHKGASQQPPVLSLPTPSPSPSLAAPEQSKPKEKPTSRAKALLERIREKQRAKEAAALISGPPIPAATRTMHSRLPGMVEAISYLFYSERKHTLPFYFVVDKLVESKGLDRADLAKHLVALVELVPEWCSITDNEQPAQPADPGRDRGDPQPGARLKVTRAISAQDAKSRLEERLASASRI